VKAVEKPVVMRRVGAAIKVTSCSAERPNGRPRPKSVR
jgi:hypothetical protein